MCDICLSSPCLARCPNAPEPEAVETCKYCNESIVEGDEMEEIGGYFYHVDCISSMSTTELLEKAGIEITVAERYAP